MVDHRGRGDGLSRPESSVAWISELVGRVSLPKLFFLKQSYENKNQSYTELA